MLPSMVPSVGTAFRAGQAWIAVPPAIKAAGLTYLPPRNPISISRDYVHAGRVFFNGRHPLI